MAAFSILYMAAAVALYRIGLGDTSLVYANIFNLSARIVYSAVFISSYFKSERADNLMRWKDMWPTWKLLLVLVASAASISYSDRTLHATKTIQDHGRLALLTLPVVLHVGLGGVLALACVATWWIASGRFLSLPRRIKKD
jgi:oligosaccharide translocation protein RFT1